MQKKHSKKTDIITDAALLEGVKALGLDKSPVCLAPYAVMNFDTNGNTTVCCYNRKHVLGRFPENSLREMWFNNKVRKKIIEATENYDFSLGCQLCYDQITSKNKQGLIPTFHRCRRINPNGYPAHLEFEFSNMCNSECIMCGGKWSSSIRKNRECLPPIQSPFYCDSFLEQLDEFLPHLLSASFSGGEPFLSSQYYGIWERLSQINKNIHINAITNGSIYDKKVENVLNMLPWFKVTVSFDSAVKDTYQSIRKNLKYDTVVRNIERFARQRRLINLNCCVLRQNIDEIEHVVRFAERLGVEVMFVPTNEVLGGFLKGIHENGTSEYAWNGISGELLPQNKLKKLLPDTRISALSTKELQKYVKKYEDLRNNCAPYMASCVQSLICQLQSALYKKEKSNDE